MLVKEGARRESLFFDHYFYVYFDRTIGTRPSRDRGYFQRSVISFRVQVHCHKSQASIFGLNHKQLFLSFII